MSLVLSQAEANNYFILSDLREAPRISPIPKELPDCVIDKGRGMFCPTPRDTEMRRYIITCDRYPALCEAYTDGKLKVREKQLIAKHKLELEEATQNYLIQTKIDPASHDSSTYLWIGVVSVLVGIIAGGIGMWLMMQ